MVYTLSWSKDVVSVKLTGVVDAAVLMAMAGEISSDYRFDELRKRIYDCSDVEEFNLSLHDIKTFIHVDNASYMTNPNAHIAIVTRDGSVAESIEFYRHRFAHTDWQVHVCDTLGQAKAWCPDHDGGSEALLARVAEPHVRPAN